MDEFVTLLVNNGVAVAVIAYFMFRDYKFMGQLQQTLQTLVTTVDTLKDIVASKSVQAPKRAQKGKTNGY